MSQEHTAAPCVTIVICEEAESELDGLGIVKTKGRNWCMVLDKYLHVNSYLFKKRVDICRVFFGGGRGRSRC